MVFFVGDNLQSLPPRERGTAAGFPETNEMSFGGSRVSGGRSLRDFGVLISFIVTRSPSVAFGASSLPEGAFVYHSSADSGFGLLPDGARTATRYACPRRKRWESGKARKRNDRKILRLVELSLCCGY